MTTKIGLLCETRYLQANFGSGTLLYIILYSCSGSAIEIMTRITMFMADWVNVSCLLFDIILNQFAVS